MVRKRGFPSSPAGPDSMGAGSDEAPIVDEVYSSEAPAKADVKAANAPAKAVRRGRKNGAQGAAGEPVPLPVGGGRDPVVVSMPVSEAVTRERQGRGAGAAAEVPIA